MNMEMIAAMKPHYKSYEGKSTIAKLAAMPIETIEDRLRLMLELSTYASSLNYQIVVDGTSQTPNLIKVRELIESANSLSHNTLVVRGKFVQAMIELSFEIKQAINGGGVYELLPEIYKGKANIEDFLVVPKAINTFNKVFAFKGLSGKTYSGSGITDIGLIEEDELLDILNAHPFPEDKDIVDFILSEKGKEEIKKHSKKIAIRTVYMAYFNHKLGGKKSNVIDFIKEKLSEDLNKKIEENNVNASEEIENPSEEPLVGHETNSTEQE